MTYTEVIRKASPWRELNRLQQEMDRMFHTDFNMGTYPPVNVWTSDNDVIVTAELPGFDLNNINLSIVGNELTIKGKRERPDLKEGEFYHRRERIQGEFERTIQLPFVVDRSKAMASFKDGVLRVDLPRAESDKPITIEIKSN